MSKKEYRRCYKCVHARCPVEFDRCTPECHAYEEHASRCICAINNYDRDGNCPHFKEEKKKPEEIK